MSSFKRFADDRLITVVDDKIVEVETDNGRELYQPSIMEHILHLFGKHIWTIGVSPKYCVYPNCKNGPFNRNS